MVTEVYFNPETKQFWAEETKHQFITTDQVEMVLHVKEHNGVSVLDARDFVENVRVFYTGETTKSTPVKSVRAGKVAITELLYDPRSEQFWAKETGHEFITVDSLEMAKHVVKHNSVSLQKACQLVSNVKARYEGEEEPYPCKL